MAGARGGSLAALLSFRKSCEPDRMGPSEAVAQAAPFSAEGRNLIEGATGELRAPTFNSCCDELTQLFSAAILAFSPQPLTPDVVEKNTFSDLRNCGV